ncbi:MAG: hypothetical protein WAQ25_04850 [Candidatus Saccharimonas sp.]
MSLLLLTAVVVLVSLLARQSSNWRNKIDYTSMSYRQGYWDGVRAAEQKTVSSQPSLEAPVSESKGEMATETQQPDAYMAMLDATAPPPKTPVHTQPAVPQSHEGGSSRSQTINIALYSATLLLVGGVMLLAQTIGLGGVAKFVLVWLMIGLYYVFGLVLARQQPILKPAALAFVGTALASIPIAGVVMYYLVTHNAALCWLVTSLIGTVLYAYATVGMKSQTLGYISLISLFVLSCSLPAVANAQLVWYYVVMIVFGSAMTVISHVGKGIVPKEFAQPVQVGNALSVPLALLSSLVSFRMLSAIEYTAILTTATVYYCVQALVNASHNLKNSYWIIGRSMSIIAIACLAWALPGSTLGSISIALAGASGVQILASLIHLRPRKPVKFNQHEAMVWIGFIGALLSTALVVLPQSQHNATVMAVEYVVIAVVAFVAMVWLRRYSFGYIVAWAATVLPFIIGWSTLVPPIRAEWLLVYFIVMIKIVLLLHYSWQRRAARRLYEQILTYLAVITWLLVAAGLAASAGLGWVAIWWVLTAAVLYYVAVVEKAPVAAGFANASGMGSVLYIGWSLHVSTEKNMLMLSWASLLLCMTLAQLIARRPVSALRRQFITVHHISLLVQAAVLSVIGLALVKQELLAVLTWLPFVIALYYVAVQRRSLSLLVCGNGAVVVLLALITVALRFSWMGGTAFVTIVSLALFIALSEYLKRKQHRQQLITAMRDSGLLTAVTTGMIALFGGFMISGYDVLWQILAWLTATGALYVYTWCRRKVAVLYGANAALIILMMLITDSLHVAVEWGAVSIAWTGFIAFYGIGYALPSRLARSVRVRQVMFWSAVLAVIGFGAFASVISSKLTVVFWGSMAIIAMTVAWGYRAWRLRQIGTIDIAAVICMLAFQRIVVLAYPHLDSLVLTHLWAIVALALALYYRRLSLPYHAKGRLIAGMTLITIPTLSSALSNGGFAQVVFLVEHVAMLVAGLLRNYRLAALWGSVGVTLAVLYMLRGYTSLLAIVVGMLIISVVVWVIVRGNKHPPAK